MTRPPQHQVALLVFLLVVLGFLCARSLPPRHSKLKVQMPAGKSGALSLSTGRPAPESASSRQIQRQEAQRLAWRRDPFTRTASVEPEGGLTLSGILWDADQPMAILNGQIVRVGETVEGYRVLEIAKDHVTVTDGSRVLQLNPQ